jgi:hypothetical protein
MTFLRTYVTGSNDAILSKAGRTTAVFGGGRIRDQGLRRDTSSWSRQTTLVLRSGFMTSWDWRLSFHNGQLCLRTGASHTAA